jgi:hypothetical protein
MCLHIHGQATLLRMRQYRDRQVVEMNRACNMLIVALLVVIPSGITVPCRAEEPFHPSKTKSPLQEEFDVIESHFTDKTAWNVSVEYAHPEYPLKSNGDVINAVEQWAQSAQLIDRCKGYIAEHELVTAELPRLKLLLDDMSMIGRSIGHFLYADTILLPVRFARRDTATTLLITGIASESVYNTLRTTSNSRAARVVQSMIIPTMRSFVEAFHGSKVGRYGMCVTYGSKNFIEDDTYGNQEAETVAFVAPANAARRFVSGEITEDELLNASDVYLSDRDLRMDFKKVKLTFE